MSLQKKAVANFVGGVIPAIASLLTVPVIVSRLGTVEYGLFTLVTAIVGYFAMLDINVAAGSVKFLSEHHARDESKQVNQVVTFGGVIYLMIGLLGGCGIFLFADLLVTRFFNVPRNLHEIARITLQFSAIAFFFGQIQSYLISIPQALQRYDLTSKFESSFGALTSISTVIVVLLGGGLVEIVSVRLVLSIINCGLLLRLVRKILPFIRFSKPEKEIVSKVASFSAYAYLNKLAAITYTNGDNLLLGALQDMRAVSFYSVPFLLINRAMGLIYRLGGVIFPASSAMAAKGQHEQLRRTYLTGTRYLIYLNATLCLSLSVFSRELLHYWAGPVFGAEAAFAMVLIAMASFFDSMTNLPSLVNDGLGKPRNTGTLALTRALVGITLAYFAIKSIGFLGAAWALAFTSAFFATAFIIFVHGRSIPVSLKDLYWEAYHPTLVPALALLIISAVFSHREVLPLPWFFALVAIATVLFIIYAWLVICLPVHRAPLLAFMLRYLGFGSGSKT
jgi:O-antigen/teichoic acid export membrane protein